jgi:hypothetical protein
MFAVCALQNAERQRDDALRRAECPESSLDPRIPFTPMYGENNAIKPDFSAKFADPFDEKIR